MELRTQLVPSVTAVRRSAVAILLLQAAACSGPTTVEDEVWVAGIIDGGFDDTGTVSIYPYTNWPAGWSAVYSEYAFDEAGGMAGRFGRLLAPTSSDAVPEVNSPLFGFLATQDFRAESRGDTTVVVRRAGMEQTFTVPMIDELRLRFDYAFATGEYNTGPDHNDFARVLLILEEQRERVIILSLDRDQLQNGGSGPISYHAIDPTTGCGSQQFGDTSADYPLCTGWRRAVYDLSPYAGQEVTLRFIVEEVGGNHRPTALLFDNVRLKRVVRDGNP